MKTPKIEPEFKAMIPDLSEVERANLRDSIKAHGGAREPILTWRGFIVDGHNRFEICTELRLPYTTTPLEPAPKDKVEVKSWMFANQIARRNLSQDQIYMLAALRGVTPPAPNSRKQAQAAALLLGGEAFYGPVISGKRALQHKYNDLHPAVRSPKAKAAPETDRDVPHGMRVKGVSTLRKEDGTVQAEWEKTERDSDDTGFESVPAGHHVSKVSTLLDSQGNIRAQWVQAPQDKINQEAALIAALKAHVESYRGLIPPCPDPQAQATEILTVYPLGDPHIGMLAWAAETGADFDLKIAEQDLCNAMDRLVAGAAPSHTAELVNLGDFFHAEDDQQRTPGHGHKLDVDSRASKVARVGITIMRRLIERCLEKHTRVRVRNLPGNHDPLTSRWLSIVLESLYENEPRVEIVPNMNPYSFLEFGKCMFCYTHGDGAKPEAMPGLMAAMQPEMWGRTLFRYAHGGHVHHISRKEFTGVLFESHRTLAGKDAWHHGKGYMAGQSLSAITYHGEYGEIERKTVDIRLARRAAT